MIDSPGKHSPRFESLSKPHLLVFNVVGLVIYKIGDQFRAQLRLAYELDQGAMERIAFCNGLNRRGYQMLL
jgi:hypothetical protein